MSTLNWIGLVIVAIPLLAALVFISYFLYKFIKEVGWLGWVFVGAIFLVVLGMVLLQI